MPTKKEFEAIAAILWNAMDVVHNPGENIVRETIAQRLCAHYASRNPRFDTTRFLKACRAEY